MLDLSIVDKKILCTLKLKENPSAQAYKETIAADLAVLFEEGTEDVTADFWTAKKYRKKAHLPPKPKHSKLLSTHNAYDKFSRYSKIRLFLVRLNRVVANIHKPFLGDLFKFFGLSYGLEFCLDLAVVFTDTFLKPVNSYEPTNRWKRYWQRFKKAITKDDRPYRMANAAVWFTVNTICLFLTGGISGYLNLAGFNFDIINLTIQYRKDYNEHKQFRDKLTVEVATKESELEKLKKHENNDSTQVQNCEHEITKLKFIRDRLDDKIVSLHRKHIYKIVMATILVIGMILVFIPPTSVGGLALVGGVIALASGSLFSGLGKSIYDDIQKARKKRKKKSVIRAHPISPTQGITPTCSQSYVTHCSMLINNSADTIRITDQLTMNNTTTSNPMGDTSCTAKSTPIPNLQWMQKRTEEKTPTSAPIPAPHYRTYSE